MYISLGTIIVEPDESLESIESLVCQCGHRLYSHGVYPMYDQGRWTVLTSQCTLCGYDKETQKFHCTHFRE